MLIPPPFPDSISQLCGHGQLAIPDLPWVAGVPPLVLNKPTSLRAMYSFLQREGFQEILDWYLPGVENSQNLNPGAINILEAGLLADIHEVIAEDGLGNYGLLGQIAIGIQLWGGKMGRNPFVQPGFINIFPIESYATMIQMLMHLPANAPLQAATWAPFVELAGEFRGLGPSFLTKHLSFWSRAPGAPVSLPILDRKVKGTFIDPRRPNPSMKDYPTYHQQLTEDCAILQGRAFLGNISITAIERQLFNFTNSPAASIWHR